MKKILLIEDEEMLIRMYQDKFSRAGFDVTVARTAEEGIDLAKAKKPDLIVLDIILPNESGVFFLKKLNQQEKNIKEIPVIVFSNYDNPETEEAVMEFGAREYIIKADHDPEEVVEKIKTYFVGKDEKDLDSGNG